MIFLSALKISRRARVFCDGKPVLGATVADTERGIVYGYSGDMIDDVFISRRTLDGDLQTFCLEGCVEVRDVRTGKVLV